MYTDFNSNCIWVVNIFRFWSPASFNCLGICLSGIVDSAFLDVFTEIDEVGLRYYKIRTEGRFKDNRITKEINWISGEIFQRPKMGFTKYVNNTYFRCVLSYKCGESNLATYISTIILKENENKPKRRSVVVCLLTNIRSIRVEQNCRRVALLNITYQVIWHTGENILLCGFREDCW